MLCAVSEILNTQSAKATLVAYSSKERVSAETFRIRQQLLP